MGNLLMGVEIYVYIYANKDVVRKQLEEFAAKHNFFSWKVDNDYNYTFFLKDATPERYQKMILSGLVRNSARIITYKVVEE